MRRTAQEIQDKDLIERVIASAQVCRLGLSRDNQPYIVPISFGYDGECIYFHSAAEGLKLDYIAANPQVCFEFDDQVQMLPNADQACKWSVSYYSVIGFGKVVEIVDRPRKVYAVNQIMAHYSDRELSLDEQQLDKARVWSISIEQMTGKRSKDKVGA